MAYGHPSELLDFSKDWKNVYSIVYPPGSFIQILGGMERDNRFENKKMKHTAAAIMTRNQAPLTQFNSQGEFDFFKREETEMANT